MIWEVVGETKRILVLRGEGKREFLILRETRLSNNWDRCIREPVIYMVEEAKAKEHFRGIGGCNE